ncbi:unnamed protein product [Prorocentrum cordatum]|uniref:EF-hand domain-containing protein n=1 Tax=Prorocentrum cordatum TaxID=2364126 RepID=A0ABN9SV70_9DINO|nr:unnamed protein product [Polarella glacialis]
MLYGSRCTGTESVRPTEQPAQPPEESARLPPQPMVHTLSGSRGTRLSGSRVAHQKTGVSTSGVSTSSRATRAVSKAATNAFSDTVLGVAAAAKEREGRSAISATTRESQRRAVTGVFAKSEEMGASFEFFFGAVIGTSAIMSGVEVQYRSMHIGEELPVGFVLLRHAYTVLLAMELAARVCKLGVVNFFCKGEVFWAWLDTLVVLMALIEMAMDVLVSAADELPGAALLSSVRLARLVRLTRAFRLHRIIRFVAALRMLVYSILATLKSLLWAMVLLVMIIYVFGLAFTMQALDHVESTDDLGQDERARLTQEWGSLDVSMYTLFQSISGGVSWRDPALTLQIISVVPTALFTVYIAFVYFAVLNVITGVFCSSAVESTQRNPDLVAKSIIDNKRVLTEKLQQLFGAIDGDESGRITIDELELFAEDDLMKAYFQALQIDVSDAFTLFKLIDSSNDGAIKLDDFLRGCEKLRGNATSMDIAEIGYDMKKITQQVSKVLTSLEKRGHSLTEKDVVRKPSLTIQPSARGSSEQ